jgi:hypothetical protein
MTGKSKRTRPETSSGLAGSCGTGALFPVHRDPRILRRWEYWAPFLRLEGEDLIEAARVHSGAMQGMLRSGVEVREIARTGMDDPRIPDVDRGELLRMYLEGKSGRKDIRDKGFGYHSGRFAG